MKKFVSIGVASFLGVVPLVTGAGASTPTTLTGLSATQVLSVSLKAASTKQSATTVLSALGNTLHAVITAGPRSGSGSEVLDGHKGEFIYSNGVIYTKFDATMVHFEFGVTDTSVANKWISATKSSKFYYGLSANLTLPSILLLMHPADVLSLTSPTTVNGVAVIGVAGKLSVADFGVGGTSTLYVSTTAPFLPEQLLLVESKSGLTANVTFTFKNWGVPVSVTAPKNFTPIGKTNLPH